MSRTSWKPRRVLGSAALACTLLISSAVPAVGAVSLSPVVPATTSTSTTLASGAWAASSASQPALAAATPKVSGTARVGQRLTATIGAWTPGTTHTYQWFRNGVTLKGATAKTYTPAAADLGTRLTVRVTGSKAGYASTTVTSAPSPVVATGILTAPKPKVPNAPKVGQKLTASVGAWTAGAALKYQWYRNGAALKGATAKSYTATAADRGKALSVKVTGSKAAYATKTVTSAASKPVAAGTLKSPVPKISGTATVGKKLSVNRGSWTSGTKLTQRWYRNGAAISGATGTAYTLKSADAGKTITVKVTGAKAGYTTMTKASAGVKVQAAAKPKASGVAKPTGKNTCPTSHPVKGNANSGIYHVPGGRYYNATNPEECFKNAAAAQAAGYRASRNG